MQKYQSPIKMGDEGVPVLGDRVHGQGPASVKSVIYNVFLKGDCVRFAEKKWGLAYNCNFFWQRMWRLKIFFATLPVQ